MSDDPRLDQLFDKLLNSNVTPEEACRSCPELLPQVQMGWKLLRAFQTQISVLFPQSQVNDNAASLPFTSELPVSVHGIFP